LSWNPFINKFIPDYELGVELLFFRNLFIKEGGVTSRVLPIGLADWASFCDIGIE
jgi:hypothetical protein